MVWLAWRRSRRRLLRRDCHACQALQMQRELVEAGVDFIEFVAAPRIVAQLASLMVALQMQRELVEASVDLVEFVAARRIVAQFALLIQARGSVAVMRMLAIVALVRLVGLEGGSAIGDVLLLLARIARFAASGIFVARKLARLRTIRITI
jgi:hypothetical protein